MRYGRIVESDETAAQFRINSFLQIMDRIDLGNCGVPLPLQAFVELNRSSVEDIFIVGESLYILPSSRKAAKELFDLCVNEDRDGKEHPLADEIEWTKMGDRYWLSLWWD